MNMNTLTTIVVLMGLLQFLIIILISRTHKKFLDQYKAVSYGLAIKELCKSNPIAGYTIRLCYLACLVEILILFLAGK